MNWLKKWTRNPRRPSLGLRARLNLEALETRLVPYSVSGGAWPHPQLVTISFVPDGTDQGGIPSNLFAKFNAHPGWTTATWENQILKAAQQWARQTNINFAVVPDNGTGIGGGLYQQGDPGMGDIRIGGYNFGTGDLAEAEIPPPINNYSVAGDIDFNTGQSFNINMTYDLYSVSMHEIGHALGMQHSLVYGAVMQAAYSIRSGLSSDDIAGIRNIYSSNNPRSYDAYYGAPTPNNSFANAADISSSINPSTLAGTVSGLDITTTSVNEYFKFNVPSGSQTSFTVTVQSSGLSLLAPTLSVYNSSQTLIGTVSGAGHYGTTITYTVTGASAGQLYYIKVAGADASAFGTGAYGVVLNFGTLLPAPTIPSPNTQTLNGFPLQDGGGTPQVPDGHTGAPGNSPASQTNSSAPALPSAALIFVSSNQASVTTGQTLSTTLVNASAAAQTTLLSAAQGTASAAQVAPGSRLDSGHGQDNGQTIADNLDELAPPAFSPDILPAASGVPSDAENLVKAPAGALPWRDASNACFAADAVARGSVEREKDTSAPGQDSGQSLDCAAAASCLLVALGSYWHPVPEESAQSKRRPLQV